MDSIDKPDTNQKSTVIIRWDLLSLRSRRHACRRLRTETCVSRIKIGHPCMYLGPAWIASINHTQIRWGPSEPEVTQARLEVTAVY